MTQADSRNVHLQVKFIHPMEGHYLEMAKPISFGVLHAGKKKDLLNELQQVKGHHSSQEELFSFWMSDFKIRRPGDYLFFVEPEPYWEPAEDLYIIHYTKVCINALGLERGWDEPVGLETEIVPLTRPYGLWTGNLFTGQVLLHGKPVPHVEVEIEYLNQDADGQNIVHAPSDPYITQVIKADANGIFSYAMPKAGWWGFSALSEADRTMKYQGIDKKIELGAVFWVHTRDMK